jgi:hypothetical protein
MIDLTQNLHSILTILLLAQTTSGADYLPFVAYILQRLAVTVIAVAIAGVFKFFWRKIRHKRRLVCRLVSRDGFGLINGRPFKIEFEDQQGKVEVDKSPGVMMLELHNLRGDEILSDHIKGKEFTISFEPTKVRAVFKLPADDPIKIAVSGGTLTLRPQYLIKDKPLRLQVVLEGYDDKIVPEVNGEVVQGGKIKLVRLDQPGALDNLMRAFTFVVIGFLAVFLFILLLGLQLTNSQSLWWLFFTSALMALILTAVPYSIYCVWLMERGAPGQDFPPRSFWGRISKYLPSIKFKRGEGFFWKMSLIAFVLFLLPGMAEMWLVPPLTNLSSFVRKLIGI